jgi:predicted RNase H-like nuclease (RuvC/YqgF family)
VRCPTWSWQRWALCSALALFILLSFGRPSNAQTPPQPSPNELLTSIEQDINDSLTSLAKVSVLWRARKISDEQLKAELLTFSAEIENYKGQLKTLREQAAISSAAYEKSSAELKAEILKLTGLLNQLQTAFDALRSAFDDYKSSKDKEVLNLNLDLAAKDAEMGFWKAGGVIGWVIAVAAVIWALLK